MASEAPFETGTGTVSRSSSWKKRSSLLCAANLVTKTSDLKMHDGICVGPLFDSNKDEEHSVKLVKGHSTMIGLAPSEKIDKYMGADAFQKVGWYLHQADGTLWSQGSPMGESYCDPIEEGSVVTVRFEANNNRVSFLVNGKDQGEAFTKLWGGPYRLTVLLCREGNTVELM